MASKKTAENTLRSWLISVGALVDSGPNETIVVNGTVVAVLLSGDIAPENAHLAISAEEISGRNPAKLVNAFHRVTEAAGMGKPEPPTRGVPNVDPLTGNLRKVDYHDDEFLVALRHAEFRRAPNPSPEALAKYYPIGARAARAFHRFNTDFCHLAGLDLDDLLQYARCWTVTFLGLYERRESDVEDRKLFTVFVQQRFSELQSIYEKKMRSSVPDADTVSIAMFGDPYRRAGGNFFKGTGTVDKPAEGIYFIDPRNHDGPDEEAPFPDPTEDEVTQEASKRRRGASSNLKEHLEQLGEDRAFADLERIGFTSIYDPGARDEARRRWRLIFVVQPLEKRIEILERIVSAEHYERRLQRGALQMLRLLKKKLELTPKEPRSGRLVPQANALPLVRRLVASIKSGLVDSFELSEACGFCTRQAPYYRHAAIALNLMDERDVVTPLGIRLLGTEPGTPDESEAFREGIKSPAMAPFSWFFKDPSKDVDDLTKFVSMEFGMAESTARRRASALGCWRERLKD